MPWDVRWSAEAQRDMHRLDSPVARRVHAKVAAAANNPARSFRRLAGSDLYKLRVGDWRVIAMLSHAARTVIVQRVDHRSRVYDR